MSEYERQEKEEKGGEDRGIEEKWARDPLGTAMGALILVWLGLTLLAANLDWALVQWGNWWAWFLLGMGAIFILEALVRLAVPEYRRPVTGRIIGGIVLMIIGASGSFLAFDLERWWPIIPIGIGVAILLAGLLRRRRP